MKKILLFGLGLSLIAITSSCKKDWVCDCYNTGGEIYDTSIIVNKTKSKAKRICRGDTQIGLINFPGDSNCDLR